MIEILPGLWFPAYRLGGLRIERVGPGDRHTVYAWDTTHATEYSVTLPSLDAAERCVALVNLDYNIAMYGTRERT